MKNLLTFLSCSLLVSTLPAQHEDMIIPVHRTLSSYESHEEDASLIFSLWHLPEGSAQILGPGSLEHNQQLMLIDFETGRLSMNMKLHAHLPYFQGLKIATGYTVPFDSLDIFSIKGGIGCIFGDDHLSSPYRYNSQSRLIYSFLEGRYRYRMITFIAQAYLGAYDSREVEILDPRIYTSEVTNTEGVFNGFGIGCETVHDMDWYIKSMIKPYNHGMMELEIEIMKSIFNKHFHVGFYGEIMRNLRQERHISYGIGITYKT